ncbi:MULTISPECIES: RtcB family protein [Nostoc]|uniref:tRNA-splicing ligase RtcB n=1 Tax=Nostoc paludosum FACHB-159 TaxID=2692908 RepID=A0ABR8K469_9NOSO|nr:MULTISPECIES: RtcB family protein [Nostoc]MBD2677396.1 RtcB family protein [Nostoc sp. FACHB-857]MBD2734211.1 RtcB family protein [Nostoc paludosum FACHB-159]
MVSKEDFRRINDYLWEIPTSFHPKMQVPVWIFADEEILEDALDDLSIIQAVNVARLPGLVGHVVVMPDVHQGYGMPIGGVMATRVPGGIISPGAVGYDINCGVRVLTSTIKYENAKPYLSDLASVLYRNCPSGVGEKGSIPLTNEELDQVCQQGANWTLTQGYAEAEDLQRTEEFGCLAGADPDAASKRAKERGKGQLGTLGAGNHFLEVDIVEEVFDQEAAEVMGLHTGCLAVQIHCGSRGFGHQICTDYVQNLQFAVIRYGIDLPDRELVCAPIESPEGQGYLAAMKSAANYAFANRQVLAWHTRRSFQEVFGKQDSTLRQVYDIAHNMAKIETHEVDGENLTVCVHRKGATRAFGPGFAGLPTEYRPLGQPVLVPGSMGTHSWILLGTSASDRLSFGSSCHGAGRVMSRHKAKREIKGDRLKGELEHEGISIRAGSMSGLAEEAPQAYKDVSRVVNVVSQAGIARKVARLHPVAVVKG